MKNQLIILLALFVGLTTQCGLYDKMKAQAKAAQKKVSNAYQSTKKIVKGFIPEATKQAIREFAKQNPATVQAAQQIAQKIANEEILPAVLSVMKEPIGSAMSQGAKLGTQKLLSLGVSLDTISNLKQTAKMGFEGIFGAKEEEDSAQVEWVNDMYEKQRNATTEEERMTYTKKLQDFFDGEQGQAFALRHMDE